MNTLSTTLSTTSMNTTTTNTLCHKWAPNLSRKTTQTADDVPVPNCTCIKRKNPDKNEQNNFKVSDT